MQQRRSDELCETSSGRLLIGGLAPALTLQQSVGHPRQDRSIELPGMRARNRDPDTRATRQWICICGRSWCAARAHRPGWARRALDARPRPPSPQGKRGEDARPNRAFSPYDTRRGGLGIWRRVRPDAPHGRPSGRGAWQDGPRLDYDALDLVDGDRVRRPVVELRRLRGGVPGDLLRVFERPPIRQIRRDPRRQERVAAGRGREIRRGRPPLDHRQDETPRERPARQPSARRARPPRGSRRAPRPPDGGPGRRDAGRPSRGA